MSGDAFTHAAYARILGAARASGYRFLAFGDAASHRASEHVCLLRHDCDNDLVAAERMSAIEAEHNVAATYFVLLRSAMYNPLAPKMRALIQAILARGHHLGLHFDELPFASLSPVELAREVDRERAILVAEFAVPIEVVSFHQPSARILSNAVKLSCVNTYDPADMAGFHYASDSNMNFRSGDPLELFRAKTHKRLQLLIHPEWWTETPLALEAKWRRMLAHNFALAEESLVEREDAYTVPHEISFRRKDGLE